MRYLLLTLSLVICGTIYCQPKTWTIEKNVLDQNGNLYIVKKTYNHKPTNKDTAQFNIYYKKFISNLNKPKNKHK